MGKHSKPRSEAHRLALSKAIQGKTFPFKERPKAKGRAVWNKGLKLPFKERPKAKGRLVWNKGLKGWNSGKKNPRWIEDRSKTVKSDKRMGVLCSEWREAVKARDGRRCKLKSKECSGRLETHHIYRWIDFPELRYEVSNGITLCHFHHPRKIALEKELAPLFKKLIAS